MEEHQAFFIFLYFSKSFFTEIYFRFHNLQVYTPTVPNIKAEVPPHPPAFAANNIHRGKKETWGEGGSCNNEALPDFGSEPQVTNISQLCHSKFFVFLIL